MPVAVRLVEVLAIVALVATMAAGAAVIIFMEKCLLFLSMITEPLVSVIGFFLGVLKFVFLGIAQRTIIGFLSDAAPAYHPASFHQPHNSNSFHVTCPHQRRDDLCLSISNIYHQNNNIIYKLTYVMEHLTTTMWESSSSTAAEAANKCGS